jgi:hypothetical protein
MFLLLRTSADSYLVHVQDDACLSTIDFALACKQLPNGVKLQGFGKAETILELLHSVGLLELLEHGLYIKI